jgi:hypothetical protein
MDEQMAVSPPDRLSAGSLEARTLEDNRGCQERDFVTFIPRAAVCGT